MLGHVAMYCLGSEGHYHKGVARISEGGFHRVLKGGLEKTHN